MYTSMRALSKSEVDYMQKSVENIYAKFTALVAAGRGMTVPEVDEVAQGRVWSGAEALKIGLVDEIGTLEDAIAYAAISIDGVSSISDVQIVEYPKPQTTLDMLLETLGSDKNAFAGTPLENVAEAFMNWNANESGKIYARLPYEIEIR
jgi:protease-4